jgi:FAD synthetase
MATGKRVVDDKRVRKYIRLAEGRLEEARTLGAPPQVIAKAERYLLDGKHYFSKGENATALASISYSHGLLDGSTPPERSEAQGMLEIRTRILAAVYLNRLAGRAGIGDLGDAVLADEDYLESMVSNLLDEGLLKRRGDGLDLTQSGRSKIRVGFLAGVFDLIHPGHLAFLNWAREQVDLLAVVVARDPSSQSRKGRKPIQGESDRLSLVSELRPVDYAILGDRDDIYSPVIHIKPDLILLGKDQDVDGRRIRADLARRGLAVRVVRSRVWDSGELSKTTRIFGRIARDIQS